jgi:hypothetical protein
MLPFLPTKQNVKNNMVTGSSLRVTCCPDCTSTNHKDCVGLLSIRKIIKTSKTSTLIDNIEQNLTDIKNNAMTSRSLCNVVMVLTVGA